MKVPRPLKAFYAWSLKLPFIGPRVVGPYLRFLWRCVSALYAFLFKSSNSAWENAVAAMRSQVNNLESKHRALEHEIKTLRWRSDLRFELSSAAINGVRSRLLNTCEAISRPNVRPSQDHRYTFSIVINTYNRAHTLERTLASLENLRHSAYEVVVVFGPCTDSTSEILDRYRVKFRIVACEVVNLSVSRNLGIAASQGEIVCFLDDDAVPEPNWLCHLEQGFLASEVAAVGGYIRDHTGVTFQSRALVCNRFGEGFDNETPPENVGAEKFFSLTGTNCSFRRDVLVEIGGFDEEYAYFLDETDVILRIIDAGYKVVYIPHAEVHHKYADSHLRDTRRVPREIYTSAKSKAYFCFKNALSSTPIDAVFSHLESYRSALRSAYDWYYRHDKITRDHCTALHDQVDRGLIDGISRSFLPRKLLTEGLLARHIAPFSPVSPVRSLSARLKICFLSREYPPGKCGGIGAWTHEIATALARSGHEISVISLSHNEHPTVDFEERVWVHRVVPVWQPNRTEPALPSVAQVIKDYAYTVYDEVMRIQAIRGLDCVSCPIWDLEGIACLSDDSLLVSLSLHSCFGLVLPYKKEWRENKAYFEGHVEPMMRGEVWALERAGLVVANSAAIVKDIESLYGIEIPDEKVAHVPHGIRPVEFKSTDDGFCSDELPDTGSVPIVKVLFVGRFERRKGVDLALEAAARLLPRFPQLRFDFVGEDDIPFDDDGPVSIKFKEKYAGEDWIANIMFHGYLCDAEVLECYRQCDIFIAPSRYESFGLILIEAMRFGKPCVSTRVGGMAEIVLDGETGILFDVDDLDALERGVEKLVESKSERLRLGQNGLNRFSELYTDSQMISNFEKAIRSLIAR
jgi:glycogen(starch) synthase